MSNQPADLAGQSLTPPVAATMPAASAIPANLGSAGVSDVSSAADVDLIEPEWVQAVKRTMEQYRNDPYALAQAMTALREDYLMKRYSRSVEQPQP